MPKLGLKYSCSATAKILHYDATRKSFLPKWSFFSLIFFGGFVSKVLTTSLVTFNMCFAKFISETDVWSHVREIMATVCKFIANDDSE